VLNIFNIIPDYDLNIMKDNQSIHDVTSKALLGLRGVINKVRPDTVLVQGDTTTAFVGSLAAFYDRIAVGHVEAGLRTNDKYRPFPEEINRRLTGQIADIHFTPTNKSRDNLLREGIDRANVHVTGNTVIDALLAVVETQKMPEENRKWSEYFRKSGISLNDSRRRVLVTAHRRESFGEGFLNICSALKCIATKYPDVDLIYPVHLNPNVQAPVKSMLKGMKNIQLIAPLDYEPFIYLMSRSYIILTDSGGIQEEAPSLRKPVLVMRETTERPEGVEAGTAKLVGVKAGSIMEHTMRLLDDEAAYAAMSCKVNPYGDGKASEKIAAILSDTGLERHGQEAA
jgi:UDP-N-acetylglucosamine 2-epimerase (non-hydrolysing)